MAKKPARQTYDILPDGTIIRPSGPEAELEAKLCGQIGDALEDAAQQVGFRVGRLTIDALASTIVQHAQAQDCLSIGVALGERLIASIELLQRAFDKRGEG